MSRESSPEPSPMSSRTDELLRELRDVPLASSSVPARTQGLARAAFVRAFEPVRWYDPAITLVTRASLPVVLTSIVVVYLSWAFMTAGALMQ